MLLSQKEPYFREEIMLSSPRRRLLYVRVSRQLLALLIISAFAYSIHPLRGFLAPTASAAPTELFFSEYIEGSSNNKALEIYNGTGASVNLGANAYNVQMFFNGSASAGLTINLTGTVAAGDVYVLAQSAAVQAILDQADQTNSAGWYNGDDAVVLRKGTTIIDSIGQVGNDPGTEWGTGLQSTADNTLRRKSTVCAGDTNSTDAFNPSVEWDGFATDTFGGLGSHTASCGGTDNAPTVTGTTPATNETNVALNANITINFSEAVTTNGSWFTIQCGSSLSHTATVSGGPSIFTLDPDSDFAGGETCTVTVVASQVEDQDGDDPPNNMAANYSWSFSTTAANPCDTAYTPIPEIQGSGVTSPKVGQTLTTRGVVTGDFQGSTGLNGFNIQDAAGDNNTATSDGIFVSSNTPVSVGDTVLVTGKVVENFGQTIINTVSNVTILSCGPAPTITPVQVTLPIADVADWERYEGMLVTVTDASAGPLTASEVFTLARFGEVRVSSGGRLFNPTNYVAPGAPAATEQALNNRRSLLIDDGSNVQNPPIVPYMPTTTDVFREGYTTTSVTGVLGFDFSVYRLQPTAPITWTAANPRTASPGSLGAETVRVASFNVLNFFTTIDNGSNGARGADSAAEFTRQRDKIVAAMVGLDADIVGLIEVENNGTTAVNNLVTAINAALPDANDHYTVVSDPANGYGTDAIKVTIIYRPAVVTPVGASLSDSDPIFDRRPVAQTFQQASNGAIFTVVINHFKSKGCDGSTGLNTDQGDGQSCWNEKRKQQATALLNFINGTVIPAAGDNDVLVIGDLNSYAMEDPISLLTGGGYTNLIASFIGDGTTAYSYTFDGQSGYLDHALGSSSLVSQVTGVAEWHINADEPIARDYNQEFNQPYLYQANAYRSSDHDPVVIGLHANASPAVDAGGPYDVDEGDSVTVAATGSDADGGDLTYVWDLDNDGNYETPGQSASFSAATLDGPNTRTIKVRITDDTGLTAFDESVVNVNNVAPTVDTPSISSVPLPTGGLVTASATFSDPSPDDSPFTCTVNYGDGSGDLPGTVSGNTCTGPSHAYASSGSYTVTVKVTDKDGETGSNSVSHDFVLYTEPTSANQCKNGGWQTFNPARPDGPFKNQGDCIQYVNTGK
jgi:predicted extracellular nuclease